MSKIFNKKIHQNNVKFWRSDISMLYIQSFFSSCDNIYLTSKRSNSVVQHYGTRCGINFVTQKVGIKNQIKNKRKLKKRAQKHISVKFLKLQK